MQILNTFNAGVRFLRIPPKILLIVKLIIVIMTTCLLQVSAGSFAQKLTYVKSDVTIKQIFKAVTQQTGYEVLYADKNINDQKKIDVDFKNTPLSIVLDKILEGQNVTYSIDENKGILIKAKGNSIADVTLNLVADLFRQDSVIFKGIVIDEKGEPVVGATVKVKGGRRTTFTTKTGAFAIYAPLKGTLVITYVGFVTREITLAGLDPDKQIKVSVNQGESTMEQVDIVSNGYQNLNRERSSGTFELITKEQLQHSTDPNLLKRLEGITTSLDFRNDLTPINSADANFVNSASILSRLTIRGKNTLNVSGALVDNAPNTSGWPLIVIDGVANPYPIENLNPEDVENVTILKDASAASIWGSRAANGVIVIKTKRGGYNQPLRISFNTNFSITEKLDLFYKQKMTTSDYIDAQAFLFTASNTQIGTATLTRPQNYSSPVAEIMEQRRTGQFSLDQANVQLDALRGNDIRKDYNKYLLKNAFSQNYSINLNGGNGRLAYTILASYNRNLNNTANSGSNRLNLGYNVSFKPFKNLELKAGINYSENNTENQIQDNALRIGYMPSFYPYTRLADDQGNPLTISYRYRDAFKNLLSTTYGNTIRDLSYSPLTDINQGYFNTQLKNIGINLNPTYKINAWLSADFIYSYTRGDNQVHRLNRGDSFYMRDMITYFTAKTGLQQLPSGSRMQVADAENDYHSGRGQLNINKDWGLKHSIVAIVGVELTQATGQNKNLGYYGYNENDQSSSNAINYSDNLTTLYSAQSNGLPFAKIPYTNLDITNYKIRTTSFFTNIGYTFLNKYTATGSIRKDMSSELGTGTNRSGTPFYSYGISWNIANEAFYKLPWLPMLRIRSNFGYNGNTNPTVSGKARINYSQGTQDNGLFSATPITSDMTNNLLRPEKTGVLNLGIDFGFKNNRISGSFNYYRKETIDLIANNPIDPSIGSNFLQFNTGTLLGKGAELTLNSENTRAGLFSWTSNLLLAYNRIKLTRLYIASAKTAGDVVDGSTPYNVGYDLTRIFAYRWAGLDPVTGSPRGYDINGQPIVISNSALAVTSLPLATARYFGSAVPVYYGSFRNTFSYGSLSLSANLMYKFGYYVRRPLSDLVNYTNLFNAALTQVQGGEYSNRWQRPGDELKTNVPSVIYPANTFRDQFYQGSEINVIKGDHIRLQEINLAYSLAKKGWFLKNPRIYGNINNLGVIWRANKLGIDPEVNDYPKSKTYSIGFSANF